MLCHFSIDDVGRSLRWLTKTRPASFFDMRLFGKLQEWRHKYGLLTTLYCFATIDEFDLMQIPQEYAKEFEANSDWLKLGFHGKSGDYPFSQESDYVEGYNTAAAAISNLGAGTTNMLRLHSWVATDKQKRLLLDVGVETLLYPDNEDLPYDCNGEFVQDGITHKRTDVWFEKLPSLSPVSLCVGNKEVIAFTHEWCFDHEAEKIDEALSIYRNHGYSFFA